MTTNKQRAHRRAMPTSMDVARRAGVSQAAVSYVLGGQQNRHVSEKTHEKIVQAAQELGYQVHPSARSLRRGQSDEICCIINTPPSLFSYEIHLAIQEQIFSHGYIPVFYMNPGTPTEQWRDTLQSMFARHPTGLILTQLKSSADDIHMAQRMGIEDIVLISTEVVADIPTVVFPSAPPGYLAAQHLLERGHRHLAIVQPNDPLLAGLFQQRLAGMRAAMAAAAGTTLDILPLPLSLPEAYFLVDAHLTRDEHPTGIYTFNDEYALRLLRALNDRGMHVPQDIAIVGTDDLPFCECVWPSLTSIRFDSQGAIGRRAVEMLITLLAGQPLPEDFSHPLNPQLIPREST